MPNERWGQYLKALKTDFTKLTRLDFLQPDGSVAFSLDNDPFNERNRTFLQDGSLSVNLQNGQRRSATVKLSNLDGAFDYNVNRVWFGTKVRLMMGLYLPDGTEYLLPQGVFYVKDPQEEYNPSSRTAQYNLVDKWVNLDGTLAGQLDGIFECPVGSNIFAAINGILQIDSGNGEPLDSTPASYTSYYNGKTQTLPDGSTAYLTDSPYTARYDSEGDTYASVILGLNDMLAGWIGYDATGSLRLEASQDDILDINKPILWTFTPTEKQFLGATYTVNNSKVKNDVIRVGESLSGYGQVGGRAQNFDPASDTNINLIGLRTDRQSKAGYYTDDVCCALAEFDLKRNTVLNKSVTIRSSQMFHLVENNLIAVRRPDKQGEPIERHLLTGFTLPIGSTGEMTLNCTSVQDFPVATVMSLSEYNQTLIPDEPEEPEEEQEES